MPLAYVDKVQKKESPFLKAKFSFKSVEDASDL